MDRRTKATTDKRHAGDYGEEEMRLRYVTQYKDCTGRMRRYVRLKGQPLIPLHSRPGTKAFAAEYETALGNAPNAAKLAEASRRLDEPGYVYFIEDRNFIKIGFSTNPAKRFKAYATHSAVMVTLAGIVPATRRDDLEWRRTLVKHRKRGDWFVKSPEILAFVQRVQRERRGLMDPWVHV